MTKASASAFGVERLHAIVVPGTWCGNLNTCAAAMGDCWLMTFIGSWGMMSYAWMVCQVL
jgi:hypothetical protein